MTRSQRRDFLWGAIAVLIAINLAGVVAQALWQLAHGRWWVLAVLPLHLALAWWIGVGAWRLTRWGQPPRVIHDMSTAANAGSRSVASGTDGESLR